MSYSQRDPHSCSAEELIELDRSHVWHPFTQMRDWMAEDPIMIVGAEGNTLIDARGKKYIDAVSSLWCNVHGHRNPTIDAALKAQIDRVAHTTKLGQACAPSTVLAARLAEIKIGRAAGRERG